mmetsp:Transcript_28131/g.73751  ORF Transcript_28131/g.73751 Transcript_28131/m.73751 type:complete len:282 (-) Transcript_28131:781-1626(-)
MAAAVGDGPAVAAEVAHDPHQLTDEERGWCIALRDRLKNEGVQLPSSDFFLAQFALVSKANIEKGVRRVKAYNEHVLAEYGYNLTDALAGEMPGLGFYNEKWPGCIEVCEPTGEAQCPTIVFNCAAYKPSDVDMTSELDKMVVDKMLLFDALCADLNDIRAGCHVINQAHGAGLHNFCGALEKKLSVVSQDAYPLKYTSMPLVDSGWILHALTRLARPFLREKLRQRIVVCKASDLPSKGYCREDLPTLVGGTRPADPAAYEKFLRDRLERRLASIRVVKI